MHLRIHRFLPSTRVEGPGDRACIWVQGCPIHCPGCAVPWTWPKEGGTLVSVDELVHQILTGPSIEGVTLVGGEPFFQAAALAELGQAVRDAGLSIVTFTGYVLEEIVASDRKDWLDLLSVTDLLLDGPFRADLIDVSRPWVGSKNQRFHFLTERYEHLKNELGNISNRLEIRIQKDGQVLVNGMATSRDLHQLFGDMAFTTMYRIGRSNTKVPLTPEQE
jgi:anaerobic ribonucleoside-triphosphate reductase activating protein